MKFRDVPAEAKSMRLRYFRSTAILFLTALVLIGITLLASVRVQRVTGTEIGIKITNPTGKVTVLDSGTHIYNGIINTVHILDTTVQSLDMLADPNRGDRRGRDDLRVKTVDGSNVYLDVKITYKMQREDADQVVLSSGLHDAYKYKWMRDYARSVCRTVFGELTTEEFYDSSKRTLKAVEAKDEMNQFLEPYGLEVIRVVAAKFRFHEEYETKIREKKLADQEVEEQMSKANAARQRQRFQEVKATKEKEVAIASFTGKMRQLVVEATAQAEKAIREAEAYAIRTTLGADAEYYQRQKNAQAILARKKAEAAGTAKMAEALEGRGGLNIVKMEYAQRLKGLQLEGQPFAVSGETERFLHTQEGAASARQPGARATGGTK